MGWFESLWSRRSGRVTSWESVEADIRHGQGVIYVRAGDKTVWWNAQRPSTVSSESQSDSSAKISIPITAFRIHPADGLVDVDAIMARYPDAVVIEAVG